MSQWGQVSQMIQWNSVRCHSSLSLRQY